MRYLVVALALCLETVTHGTPGYGQTNDTTGDLPQDTNVMGIIVKANMESRNLNNLYEGDIIRHASREKRNAIRVENWKWKNNVIPYIIEKNGISDKGVAVIQFAIIKYNSVQSCIRWIPRTKEEDYVIIKDGEGCHSSIGRDTGPQNLVLGSSCYYIGVILHELNHAVGFFHEQSRYDRDDYILVNWENIQNDRTGDFTKQQNNIMDTLGTVYDYGSIMHYSSTTFSINGKPTLVPKFNTHGNMGQRSEMSEVDIWKINKLYGCENGDPPLPIWARLEQTTVITSVPVPSSTPTTNRSTTKLPSTTQGHVTHSSMTSSLLESSSTTSHTLQIKTRTIPTTTNAMTTKATTTTRITPTTSNTKTTKTTTTTTIKPCPEESRLPNGIPGKVQDLKVFLIENTLRVFWIAPCTRVTLTGYRLTIKNGQKHSTITIAPNHRSYYVYTANHPGTRYEMTVTALSKSGSGETSERVSTVSACGHDIFLPENGKVASIHSPYFRNEYYEPDVACQWNVKASEGQRLKIHFDAINLADNTTSCTDDYVMLNDDRFCREHPNGGYYVTVGRDAKIIFRSSSGANIKHSGFNLSIEAIDTRPNVKNVINTPGVIGLAWDPPENSKNTSYNHVLKYRILPEVNQEDIRLAPGVHEFVFPTGRNIGRQYEIELSTVTDKEEGRHVKYTLRSACGHNVTVNGVGRIQNPPSYGLYQPDVVCEWQFSSFQGRQYKLRLLHIELESSPNCENDFVSINSQKFCEANQITSSTSVFTKTAKVVFRTNGSVQGKGFIIQYEIVRQ